MINPSVQQPLAHAPGAPEGPQAVQLAHPARCFDQPHVTLRLTVQNADVLFPVSARRQLYDLSEEMAAKVTIVYYTDVRDALFKALSDL